MMLGDAEDGCVVQADGHCGRNLPCFILGKGPWPYLECSWEALVASAWVQGLLHLLGAEQLKGVLGRKNTRFNTDPALACLKR